MTVLDALKAALVQQGWEVTRENIEGGTLVLEKDGERAVVSAHLYAIKELPEDVVQRGRLLPAAAEAGLVGFVIEDDEGNFWDGTKYQDMLNDGAVIYAAKERINMPVPTNGKWVNVYAHATDGCLTTEPCSGVDTCQDCLDVRKSCGEDVEALIAAQEEDEPTGPVTHTMTITDDAMKALEELASAPPKCNICGGRHLEFEPCSNQETEEV